MRAADPYSPASPAPAGTLRRREPRQAERALLAERERLYDLLGAQFPRLGRADCEAAVDAAYDECWAGGSGPLVDNAAFVFEWRKRARWLVMRRAREVRVRRLLPTPLRTGGSRDGSEEIDVADERGELLDAVEARDAHYRLAELLAALDPDERALATVLYAVEGPVRRRRLDAARLGWSERYTKTVTERLRRSITAFLESRASGALCQERRQTLAEYVEWSLERRAAGLGLAEAEDKERWRPLWLHLEACPACRAAARELHRTEGRLELALAPPLLLGTGLLGALGRLLAGGRDRVVTTVAQLLPARARAGGGGGGIGALLGLSGKTAAGVACALCGVAATTAVVGVHLLAPAHRHAEHAPALRRATLNVAQPLSSAPAAYSAPVRPTAQTSSPRRAKAAPAPKLVLSPAPEHQSQSTPNIALPASPPARAEPSGGGAEGGCGAPGDLGCP